MAMTAMTPDALEQLARKFASRYDVYNKLALPVGVMHHVWPEDRLHERVREFQVVDVYGQSWVFEGHLRWDAEGHPKPEVYGPGWRSFKETKGLRVGDELIFYRPPPPPPNGPAGPVFVISVKREIRIGGATFSGHIAL